MVATPLPDLRAQNSTNVRTSDQVAAHRPRTVPETLVDLADWFVSFVGLGIEEDEFDLDLSREDIEDDLRSGR